MDELAAAGSQRRVVRRTSCERRVRGGGSSGGRVRGGGFAVVGRPADELAAAGLRQRVHDGGLFLADEFAAAGSRRQICVLSGGWFLVVGSSGDVTSWWRRESTRWRRQVHDGRSSGGRVGGGRFAAVGRPADELAAAGLWRWVVRRTSWGRRVHDGGSSGGRVVGGGFTGVTAAGCPADELWAAGSRRQVHGGRVGGGG